MCFLLVSRVFRKLNLSCSGMNIVSSIPHKRLRFVQILHRSVYTCVTQREWIAEKRVRNSYISLGEKSSAFKATYIIFMSRWKLKIYCFFYTFLTFGKNFATFYCQTGIFLRLMSKCSQFIAQTIYPIKTKRIVLTTNRT